MKVYYVNNGEIQDRDIETIDKKSKFLKYHSYFPTYNEALNYLLFLRLENLVDNFQGQEGYLVTKDLEGALKALKNITLEIEHLKR